MAKGSETDKLLVERVCNGDKRAFDLLVVKYQYKILGLVSSYIHDFQEVQDVTQEAFIKAYKALGKFRGRQRSFTHGCIALRSTRPRITLSPEDVVHRIPMWMCTVPNPMSSAYALKDSESL